mmetsp:Transcript_36419/g.145516  ORF Transcript_36419/g.145516 Transcript_36419/m.145516 type:complete len:91 (-) Transcript_36419:871-1143(-)
MNEYLERQSKILYNPSISIEELESTLVALELLFTDQDFLSSLIDARCSKLVSRLRRIRGECPGLQMRDSKAPRPTDAEEKQHFGRQEYWP